MEDNKIIELFFARSEAAIAELAKKYAPLCKRIAVNITGNALDAEECVNDALLGVWNAIPPQRPDSLIGFVCRITRNLATKKYHSNTAEKRNTRYDTSLDELADCLASMDSVEEELAAEVLSREINTFLQACKTEDRVMFVRRYFFSEELSEIAALFGVDAHYVSVRLHRTRSALKRHLLKKGIEV